MASLEDTYRTGGAPATPSMDEAVRALSDIATDGSGWSEIKATATASPQEASLGASLPLLKVLARGIHRAAPVKAATVATSMEALDIGARPLAEMEVVNTVGFAKNVLEAEGAVYSRRAITAHDSIEHGVMSAPRTSHFDDDRRRLATAAANIISGRGELPIQKPSRVKLWPEDLVLFHGLAELYGMARGGYNPASLPGDLYRMGVANINQRTRDFLMHSKRLATLLQSEEGPVVWLDNRGVNVPAAIEIADSPTKSTLMSVAQQIAEEHL